MVAIDGDPKLTPNQAGMTRSGSGAAVVPQKNAAAESPESMDSGRQATIRRCTDSASQFCAMTMAADGPSTIPVLGKLLNSDPRTVWLHEALQFTPWLLANQDYLADALGIELQLEAAEFLTATRWAAMRSTSRPLSSLGFVPSIVTNDTSICAWWRRWISARQPAAE